jgi:hypothetical protein
MVVNGRRTAAAGAGRTGCADSTFPDMVAFALRLI